MCLESGAGLQDPIARRSMWGFVLNATSQTPSYNPGVDVEAGLVPPALSTVLTTHSMEECEALCGRVAVLHQGSMRCVGTPAELRQTYCPYISVTVGHQPDEPLLPIFHPPSWRFPAMDPISESFNGSSLYSRHCSELVLNSIECHLRLLVIFATHCWDSHAMLVVKKVCRLYSGLQCVF